MADPGHGGRGGRGGTRVATDTDSDSHVRLVPATDDWPGGVRADLGATDRTATPVVDVVHYAPATSTGLEDGRPHTEVHRHAGTPPPPTRYATPERPCRVERVMRPLAERLGLDA